MFLMPVFRWPTIIKHALSVLLSNKRDLHRQDQQHHQGSHTQNSGVRKHLPVEECGQHDRIHGYGRQQNNGIGIDLPAQVPKDAPVNRHVHDQVENDTQRGDPGKVEKYRNIAINSICYLLRRL